MTEKSSKTKKEDKKPTCGIVMPISEIDGLTSNHWKDVLKIITEAARSVNFNSNLVSNAPETAVIQQNIVQNLYENDIVVVDVSAKNPNVMFELGLRLAFDKPTVIIKDDKTDYSFDTSPIEHLKYRRDLRHYDIISFKEELSEKIMATYKKSIADKNYSPFLQNFNRIQPSKLESKEVDVIEYLESRFSQMESRLVSKGINNTVPTEKNVHKILSEEWYIDMGISFFRIIKNVKTSSELIKRIDELVDYINNIPDIKEKNYSKKHLREKIENHLP